MKISKDDHDEFVKKIVEDVENPPETIMLRGFLGESCDEGCVRLYFDSSLQRYVEINENDILNREAIDRAQSPLGGSYIWVKADAKLTPPRKQEPEKISARFLQGQIMDRFQQMAARIDPDLVRDFELDPSMIDACPSALIDDCPPDTWGYFACNYPKTMVDPNCISLVARTCDYREICQPEYEPPRMRTKDGICKTENAICETDYFADCLEPTIVNCPWDERINHLRRRRLRQLWRSSRRR